MPSSFRQPMRHSALTLSPSLVYFVVAVTSCQSGGNVGPVSSESGGNQGSSIGGAGGGLNLDALGPSISVGNAKDCGNGALDPGEQCDDGNTVSGDGCSAICQVEADWTCVKPGQACAYLGTCGNGVVTSNKACDDGNTASGDGCAGDCKSVEPGFICRVPGKPCTSRCGDGITSGFEQCDDGNTVSGDGCSATCKLEPGFVCGGAPSVCKPTVCGDAKFEGSEGCDDGNSMPFDGCSEECQIEPTCSNGKGCTSDCGDGILMGSKQCDDGNKVSGDGCSSTCQVEAGWTCSQPPLGKKMMVPVIYRDFRFHNPVDFEAGVLGQNGATKGMVENDLDKDGKPVFTGLVAGHIASQDTFAQWYRTAQGVNHPTATKLALWDNGNGGYVNRYGPNGERWQMTDFAYYCGNVGEEQQDASGKALPCTSKYGTTDCDKKLATGESMLKCIDTGGQYSAILLVKEVDGNPLFFPIDDDPFSADQLEPAQEVAQLQLHERGPLLVQVRREQDVELGFRRG
jgi:cysteine-rich repeat protein